MFRNMTARLLNEMVNTQLLMNNILDMRYDSLRYFATVCSNKRTKKKFKKTRIRR